jgi:hypothetical protein
MSGSRGGRVTINEIFSKRKKNQQAPVLLFAGNNDEDFEFPIQRVPDMVPEGVESPRMKMLKKANQNLPEGLRSVRHPLHKSKTEAMGDMEFSESGVHVRNHARSASKNALLSP